METDRFLTPRKRCGLEVGSADDVCDGDYSPFASLRVAFSYSLILYRLAWFRNDTSSVFSFLSATFSLAHLKIGWFGMAFLAILERLDSGFHFSDTVSFLSRRISHLASRISRSRDLAISSHLLVPSHQQQAASSSRSTIQVHNTASRSFFSFLSSSLQY
jgi:hypothetical protein